MDETKPTPLTKANLLLLATPTPDVPPGNSNKPKKVLQFFGCKNCKKHFWATCYANKLKAKCKDCQTKLLPLPKEHVYGKGRFHCPKCPNKWTNLNSRGDLKQQCLSCSEKGIEVWVEPVRISPSKIKGPRKTNRKHICEGCKTGQCKSHVVHWSEVDDSASTLSTVSSNSTATSTASDTSSRGARRSRNRKYVNHDLEKSRSRRGPAV